MAISLGIIPNIFRHTHFAGDFGIPTSRLRQMLQRLCQRVQGVAEPGFAGVQPVTVVTVVTQKWACQVGGSPKQGGAP